MRQADDRTASGLFSHQKVEVASASPEGGRLRVTTAGISRADTTTHLTGSRNVKADHRGLIEQFSSNSQWLTESRFRNLAFEIRSTV